MTLSLPPRVIDRPTATGPGARYQALLDSGQLLAEPRQALAVTALQALHEQLAERPANASQGLYLWGRVGRGKTLLMDLFFDALPFDAKLRLHFHHFMRMVHKQLNELQGQADPLRLLARRLASRARVLCFDEFFVDDIGDAMLLGGLLAALYAEGVVVVATSNTPPDKLYANGLARDRFLPAIALIKAHMTEFALDGERDFRRRGGDCRFVYFAATEFSPADQRQQLAAAFAERQQVSPALAPEAGELSLLGRTLHYLGKAPGVIWFDFLALCDGPRSQHDYMALADDYHTLILSGLPSLGGGLKQCTQVKGIEDADLNHQPQQRRQLAIGAHDDAARRFIALVDEFYDRQRLLVIAGEVLIDDLYQGGQVTHAMARTQSRLTEMQTIAYQARVGLDDSQSLQAALAPV